MMMRLTMLTTITSLIGAGLAVALPAEPAQAQGWRDVTCESWQFRDAACPVPGAVRVQLLRVRGGNCIEGQSWIHDDDVIRVRNGCRAIFRIDTNSGWGVGGWDPNPNSNWNDRGTQRIRCESWQFRDQRCPVNGTIRNARISRVIAGDCRDGATWRWNRNSLFVRNGCRADFEVQLGTAGWQQGGQGGGWGSGNGWGGSGGNGNGWGGGQPITSITCESWQFRAARCTITAARQVRLARVLGGDCREGRTWGWDRNAIWVNGGCRARFDLY
jgi:Protein of unknown function (DUF3011)